MEKEKRRLHFRDFTRMTALLLWETRVGTGTVLNLTHIYILYILKLSAFQPTPLPPTVHLHTCRGKRLDRAHTTSIHRASFDSQASSSVWPALHETGRKKKVHSSPRRRSHSQPWRSARTSKKKKTGEHQAECATASQLSLHTPIKKKQGPFQSDRKVI